MEAEEEDRARLMAEEDMHIPVEIRVKSEEEEQAHLKLEEDSNLA